MDDQRFDALARRAAATQNRRSMLCVVAGALLAMARSGIDASAQHNGGCSPDCTGKQCGNDGCGGSCGECTPPATCGGSGFVNVCGAPCTPNCAGKECGDDGCGGSCGSCGPTATCGGGGVPGKCGVPCDPACSEKECGPDGCGGDCGSCAAGESCLEGLCEELPTGSSCQGKVQKKRARQRAKKCEQFFDDQCFKRFEPNFVFALECATALAQCCRLHGNCADASAFLCRELRRVNYSV